MAYACQASDYFHHYDGVKRIDNHCKNRKDVSKTIKRANFWVRRRSHLPLIAIGTLVVMVLLLNDDASISLNMKYEREINRLTKEIDECRDSAAYYRSQREAIIHGGDNLERLAREKFHMQRPTEDVFILKEP